MAIRPKANKIKLAWYENVLLFSKNIFKIIHFWLIRILINYQYEQQYSKWQVRSYEFWLDFKSNHLPIKS